MKDKVIRIIAETMEIDPAEIRMESTFADLGLESLDLVDLVVAFESEFGMEIPDQDIKGIQTVGDIVKYAETHKG